MSRDGLTAWCAWLVRRLEGKNTKREGWKRKDEGWEVETAVRQTTEWTLKMRKSILLYELKKGVDSPTQSSLCACIFFSVPGLESGPLHMIDKHSTTKLYFCPLCSQFYLTLPGQKRRIHSSACDFGIILYSISSSTPMLCVRMAFVIEKSILPEPYSQNSLSQPHSEGWHTPRIGPNDLMQRL
jgi:hypothetical protein